MLVKIDDLETPLAPYTVRAKYYRDEECGDRFGTVMVSLLFQGSEALNLHILEERWPSDRDKAAALFVPMGNDSPAFVQASQWAYMRRLMYGALQLSGRKPDHGTARLVEPMAEAVRRAMEAGHENREA